MTIPYRIEKLETLQFAILQDQITQNIDIQISSEFNFAVSEHCDHIRCIMKVQFLQDEKVLMLCELACHFQVSSEAAENISKEGKIEVNFLHYIATIAVGAMRGVIHVKTQGTALNAIVLPPINLVEAIKEDFFISEKNNFN